MNEVCVTFFYRERE